MAASSGAIRAGRAFVELFADDSKLVRGLKSAEKKLKAWGASVASIGRSILRVGAGIAAAFVPALGIFASMGDALNKMAGRTGIAVEQLSSLAYAAEQSGATVDELEVAIKKMQDTLAQAAGGSKTAAAALGRLGLSVRDLQHLAPDEQFRLIADRLSMIKNPALRTAAALDIFGKSGTRLIPMLANGRAGLKELEDRAKALGLVMSKEDAEAATALGDAWSDLISVGKGFVKTIGAALAPALTKIILKIVDVTSAVMRWLDENRQLVVTAVKIAGIVVAAGVAFVALGVAVWGLGAAFGVLSGILAGIGVVLGTIAAGVAALLTPMGMLVAAVVAAGGAWLYFSGAGKRAVEYVLGLLRTLSEEFAATWQGIVDAVMAGDLELAAKIAWLGLQVQFQKVVLALREAWAEWGVDLLNTATEAIAQVQIAFVNMTAGFKNAWMQTTEFLKSAWLEVSDIIDSTLVGIQSALGGIIGAVGAAVGALTAVVDKLQRSVIAAQALLGIATGAAGTRAGRNAISAAAKAALPGGLGAAGAVAGEAARKSAPARQRGAAQIEAERGRAVQDILNKTQQVTGARTQGAADAIKASEEALAKAREDLAASIAEAARKRAGLKPTPGLPSPGFGPDISGLLEKQKITAAGSFNARAAGALGGKGPLDRVAKFTEQTALNTKKLVAKGPKFT